MTAAPVTRGLPTGAEVRVCPRRGAGLDRYRGTAGHVISDDGIVVEVAIPGMGQIPLWPQEVEPVIRPAAQDPRRPLTAGCVTGSWLRAERVRAALTQSAVARAMGVSAPRVSVLERQRFVSLLMAARYLQALRGAAEVAKGRRQ